MMLDAVLRRLVEDATRIASDPARPPEFARRALPLLDLTSLNDDDTPDTVEALCDRAVTPNGKVAAVCVWRQFAGVARHRLWGTGVRVAAVVNFPAGEADPARILEETALAIEFGAEEIDIVLPYRRFQAGDVKGATAVLRACRDVCEYKIPVKVILESGTFTDAGQLADAARLAIDAGADFLKTSTGKIAVGATLEAAAVMLTVIRDSGRRVGFKVSGGVRDITTAAGYLALADAVMGSAWVSPATFRFGASALLDSLLAGI